MPLVELARQRQAFPVVLNGRDRIPALQDAVAEIVEIDRDAEGIPDAAADLEGLLNQRLAPRELAPAVIGPTQVAQDDADLPVVANRTGDRQCLFLVGHGLVVIALPLGDETQIVQAARDTGLISQRPEPLQRLGEERFRPGELALIASQNAEPAQRARRDVGIAQLLGDVQALLEIRVAPPS